jgi:hypothetical protein
MLINHPMIRKAASLSQNIEVPYQQGTFPSSYAVEEYSACCREDCNGGTPEINPS